MKKGYVNYTVGTVGIWVLSLGISLCCLGRAQAMEVLPAEKAGKAAAAKVVSDPQERILDLTVSADVRQLMEERGEEGIRLNVCTSSPEKLEAVVNRFQKKYSADIKYIFERINCATVRVEETHLQVIGKDIKLVHLLDSLQTDGILRDPEHQGLLETSLEAKVMETSLTGKAFSFPQNRNTPFDEGDGIRPNDAGYDVQWSHKCTDIERGWEKFGFHHKTATIAILDSGVDRDHPDLMANLNFEEGYDFANSDPFADDNYGHGTAVAGLAAGVVNNGIMTAGVLNATILPIKVYEDQMGAFHSDIAAGINYAIEKEADVINMSLGGQDNEEVRRMCQAAYNDGIIVVAAAGNGGGSNGTSPAKYTSVIGVGALGNWMGFQPEDCSVRWWYSNVSFGDHTREGNVEIMAPGGYMPILGRDGSFDDEGYTSGTSWAAPYVAGIAAGYVSLTNWTNEQIRSHMQEHADPLDGSGDNQQYCVDNPRECYGYGRVDAYPFADGE